jgi:hypothetical protein
VIALALVVLVVAQEAPAEVPSAEVPPAEAAPATTAPTEPPLVFDDGAFDDGMSYYNRFEFEKASFRFRAATRSKDKPAPEVARAHLWLGLALAQAGDEVGAREAFIDAIALDKNVVLPMDAPPNLRPIFDDAYAHPRAPQSADDVVGDVNKKAVDDAMPLTTIVGAVVAGGGVLAFAGGAIVGAVAVSQADAANQERFQDDALAAHEQAAGTATIANALLVTGAAASVVGAAVVVAGALLE